MVELSGSLAGMDLVPMVRVLSELRQTGSLQLARDGWSARLDLRDGRVVSAAFADERGLNALTALGLLLHDAEFVYIEGPPPAVQELDLAPDRLGGYLEAGARMGVLSLDAVPRPTLNGLAALDDEEVVLHRSTVRQLLAIDGQRTIGELLGGRPTSTVLLDLARLIELGLIGLDHRSWIDAGADRLTAPLPLATAVSTLNHVGEVSAPRGCPYLGFADDPSSRYERPTAVHRCYANGSRSAVSTLEQRQYCLNEEFERCPRLRPMLAPPLPASSVSPQHSTTSQLNTPQPAALPPPARGMERRLWSDRILPAVSIALTALAVLALFFAFVRPRLFPAPDPEQSAVVVSPPRESQPTSVPTPVSPPTVQAAPTVAAAAVPPVTAPSLNPVLPRAIPSAAPASAGGTLLDAQFSNRQPRWLEVPPFATWSNGAYRVSAREANHFVAVAAPTTASLGDVVVQATFRKVGGPSGGGYGLIVRDQQPDQRNGTVQTGQFYVFEVGDRGELGIWRRDGERWIDLKTWTPSPQVHPGNATNDLAVRIVGDRMTFLVNGEEVATEVDSTLLQGGVGLFVGGDGNEVAVDRFTATAPTEAPR